MHPTSAGARQIGARSDVHGRAGLSPYPRCASTHTVSRATSSGRLCC